MRIPRFYTKHALNPDIEVTLEANLAHYICNVLRLKEGAPVILFDGTGADFPAELKVVHKKQVSALVDAQISLHVESPLSIHLAQGVSKGERMDYALQKAVELGVSEITPVISEYCNVKLSAERWEKKQEQWYKLIISACEQCQRNVLPVLHPAVEFNQFIANTTSMTRLILVPGAPQYLSGVSRNERGFQLLIGASTAWRFITCFSNALVFSC